MSIQEIEVTKPRIINGIDVDRLEKAVAAFEAQPELAWFQFRIRNRWIQGSENRSVIQGFYGNGSEDRSRTEPFVVSADEPPVLLGTNRAPNPGEYLLHALAACVTTTLVQEGAGAGIEIEAIESAVEGDIDLRGPMGLAEDVPKGLGVIRLAIRVRSNATLETLRELAAKSPIYNTLKAGVRIEVAIEAC